MTTANIRICLFELPEKDQAVIQRVINFSASRGKQYSISDLAESHVVITLDTTVLPNHNALIIRIGASDEHLSDAVLQRPLLVTRVMRTLDDAIKLLDVEAMEAPTNSMSTTASPNQTDIAVAVTTTPKVSTDTTTQATALESNQVVEQPEPASTITTNNTTPAPPETNTQQDGYLALVVDDSAAIRKQLEIELRTANIRAEFAETGEEAVEKSAAQDFDLVFLDIIMPGIDGYEVCRQMRARPSMKKTPIIMLSGKTSPLDEVQGVIAGASTYLTKPVKHEQFQETLKRVSKWLNAFAK